MKSNTIVADVKMLNTLCGIYMKCARTKFDIIKIIAARIAASHPHTVADDKNAYLRFQYAIVEIKLCFSENIKDFNYTVMLTTKEAP